MIWAFLFSAYDFTYRRGFRRVFGWFVAAAGAATLVVRRGAGTTLLLWSHRSHLFVQRPESPTLLQRLVERWALRRAESTPPQRVVVDSTSALSPEELHLLRARGLVLKHPGPAGETRERGVLIVKFTEQFSVLRRLVDLDALQHDYTLVLEPSMSGYADSGVLGFLGVAREPIFVLASETRDFHLLARLHPHYVPVPLGSGNWVNPDIYRPLAGVERVYDAVMVAGWRLMKRHHVLFRAVRRLRDPAFRLALLGDHHDPRGVRAMLQYYGLGGQTETMKGLRAEDVNRYYASARVNVLTSRREGSNKSITEGFFADVPGLALENVIGPERSYFTPQTGLLVRERELSDALRAFQRGELQCSPRSWALEHISPTVSTATLNQLLRQHALTRGEPWTRDIVPKDNRPEMSYLDPSDRARHPEFAAVLAAYHRA